MNATQLPEESFNAMTAHDLELMAGVLTEDAVSDDPALLETGFKAFNKAFNGTMMQLRYSLTRE